MKIKCENRKELQDAALGKIKCDLAIKNVKMLNVFTGEIYPATVFVHKGFFVHIEDEDLEKGLDLANEVVDGKGEYIIPGLIDAHVHVESSMLTPAKFAKAIIPHGTTTLFTDPHEVANVVGEEGVKYMHDAALDLPMRQFVLVPSCVPAMPGLEEAGASFDAETVDRLADLENVVGLAEVMDFLGVQNSSDRMRTIIETAEKKGLYLQGHIPRATSRELSAYVIGGPNTCHESTMEKEALMKLRAGMYVDARESSISHNLEVIIKDAKDLIFKERLCLCTDDREAGDLIEIGHMNDVVNKAIKYGLRPEEAIRAATLSVANEAGVENLGAIAPGFVADFLILPNIDEIHPREVYFSGEKVAENGKLTVEFNSGNWELENRNTVNIKNITKEDLNLKAPKDKVEEDRVTINIVSYNNLKSSATKLLVEEIDVKNGLVDISGNEDLAYVFMANRYGKENRVLGLVKGFGIGKGAIGSTIVHDSHNLVVVFKDVDSGLRVCEELIESGGGMSCATSYNDYYTLPLPVFGLMSDKDAYETAKRAEKMKIHLRNIGLTQENPLLRIVTIGLTVNPDVKFSDLGLVDVRKGILIPVFPEN